MKCPFALQFPCCSLKETDDFSDLCCFCFFHHQNDAHPAIPRSSTFSFVVHALMLEKLAAQCLRLRKVMHLKRHFSLSLLNFVDWPSRLSHPKGPKQERKTTEMKIIKIWNLKLQPWQRIALTSIFIFRFKWTQDAYKIYKVKKKCEQMKPLATTSKVRIIFGPIFLISLLIII